jgi:hypothetical protein
MGPDNSPRSDRAKAADADLLGEAVPLPVPADADPEVNVPAPSLSPMPEPGPADDQNHPGFIGERNRPAP